MLRKLRFHVLDNVVGYIALFVALGGTAYAANTVGSGDVIDDSLLTADIKDNSLTGADIRGKASPGFINGSLDTYDIRDTGLLAADVAADTLTAGQLAPNSANTSEIANGAVTHSKLAPDSVGGLEILNDSVFSADLGPEAVANSELADKSISNSKLQSGSVTTTQVLDNDLEQEDIGPDAVGSGEVANDSLNDGDIADYRHLNQTLTDSTDGGTPATFQLDSQDVVSVDASCSRSGTSVTGAVTIKGSIFGGLGVDSNAPGGQNIAHAGGAPVTLISVGPSAVEQFHTGDFAARHIGSEDASHGLVAVFVSPPNQCHFSYTRLGP